MSGARKGTQVLDISHAAHLHLQKVADDFDRGGLAQGDISTYYDSLDALKIARWIEINSIRDGTFWASAFYVFSCSRKSASPLVGRALSYSTAAH